LAHRLKPDAMSVALTGDALAALPVLGRSDLLTVSRTRAASFLTAING
jgi:hypothetical protein